jgi:hypothetical protein
MTDPTGRVCEWDGLTDDVQWSEGEWLCAGCRRTISRLWWLMLAEEMAK